MEILKLYEKAASELDNAVSSCKESDVNISSITLILSDKGAIYTGLNWKRLNDSLSVEKTCSEYEAIIKLLLAGESVIDTIITLNAKTKLPVNPCTACQELIIKINSENKSCKVVSGKNSQVILTSLNNNYDISLKEPDANDSNSGKTEVSKNKKSPKNNHKISVDNETASDETKTDETKTDAQIVPENESATNTIISDSASDQQAESYDVSAKTDSVSEIIDKTPVEYDAFVSSNSEDKSNNNSMDIRIVDYDEPENYTETVPHSSVIDTAGLKMIFDDWETEKTSETSDNLNIQSNKPFNVNSLSSQQISNAPSASENKQDAPVQQLVGNNGMMYQQQPVNNMYQQQSPVNNMYQQQPVNNAMYQQQPVNNSMYQQQPVNNGIFSQMQAPVTPNHIPANNSLYINQMPQKPNNTPSTNTNYQNSNNTTSNSTYINKMQAPITNAHPNSTIPSQSVYGTNINSGDNNAIFKDRLNNILASSTSISGNYEEEPPIEEAIKSIKDKKKAAKIDAKFIKRQKKNGNL